MRGPRSRASSELVSLLSQKVVGQPTALNFIVPYIQMSQAGLAPEGRPVGVFLLLGPTGTGKTRTVEVLAEVLHGSEKHFLKIDCGEFQMDHEVAKLIGAPPGYLGHRETQPILTQQKLQQMTTDATDISIVLFDEIEKASPSLYRLLLGVLDRGSLRLGDNSTVNFDKSLIFFTSNLGAREMMTELAPSFGFNPGEVRDREELSSKLENIALAAVRKRFSPEFVNRIDAIVTYQPLDEQSLGAILDQQISELQNHVNTRLASRCFQIEVPEESRAFLLQKGTSREYGARELKRVVHRNLTQPLATKVASGEIEPGSLVRFVLGEDNEHLEIKAVSGEAIPPPALAHAQPSVLIVDDNRDLLRFLEHLMTEASWTLHTAESAQQALNLLNHHRPTAALLDYMLPDGNGFQVAVQLRKRVPEAHIVVMTGANLAPDEEAACQQYGFQLLRKPFLASDVMNLIRSRIAETRVITA